MTEKHIHKLSVNPFFNGIIFRSFYEGYHREDCSILLHYLVLPIILFKNTRCLFENINVNTSLKQIVEGNKATFSDLQERIWDLRRLTNLSLIQLNESNYIQLTSQVKVIKSIKYENQDESTKLHLRSANYLGKMFSDHEIDEVFKILNVIP